MEQRPIMSKAGERRRRPEIAPTVTKEGQGSSGVFLQAREGERAARSTVRH